MAFGLPTGWITGAFNRLTLDNSQMAPEVSVDPAVVLSGKEVRGLLRKIDGMAPEQVYTTQPNVRAAVDFRSRNIAQLGVHAYRRVDDGGRERDRESVAAKLMAQPSLGQTGYGLIFSLVADLSLYDEAWWWVHPNSKTTSGWSIRPIPVPAVVEVHGNEWLGTLSVEVAAGDGRTITIPAEQLLHFHGWSPAYKASGVSPMVALKDMLKEQVAAQGYRLSVWKNGGQIASYVSRPKDAGSWSDETARRFKQAMAEFRSGGSRQGGMPVLEDGMEIKNSVLNAKEHQFVEAAKLSLETVCRVYHIAPAMMGETGGVTYANMREFRRMLYGETLGPLIRQIEDDLNGKLLPLLGTEDGLYLEFNVEEKLRGSFEEQATVMSTSVGGPWMTVNEARAIRNLPTIDGGDAVYAPLNLARPGADDGDMPAAELLQRVNAAAILIRSGFTPEGALTSVGLDPIKHMGLLPITVQKPKDDPDADDALVEEIADDGAKNGPELEAKAKKKIRKRTADVETTDEQRAKVASALAASIRRQRKVVLSRLGSKAAPEWWDADRWDKELADDLYKVALTLSAQIGAGVAKALGYQGEYDKEITTAFIRAVVETRAHAINEGTREAIQQLLDDPDGDPAKAFDEAEGKRSQDWGASMTAALAAFATAEAGKQITRNHDEAAGTKTWVTRSGKPRASHAQMNGQTVPLGEKFSNGADWPGDSSLSADETAGCMCGVEVTIETEE